LNNATEEGLYKWVSLPMFAEWRRRKEKGKKKSGESQRERERDNINFMNIIIIWIAIVEPYI
jgi:hypothetical protein